MTDKNYYEKACYQCGLIVKATNQAQFNRNMGMHYKMRHHYHGVKTNWWEVDQSQFGSFSKPAKPIGYTAMTPEEKRAYHRKWYAKQKAKKEKQVVEPRNTKPLIPTSAAINADPIALEYCPCCKARFYAVKGNNDH